MKSTSIKLITSAWMGLTWFVSLPGFACGLRDNGATYIDPGTGLEIQKCAVGQTWAGDRCQGNAKLFSGDSAISNYWQGNWRLINKEEAEKITRSSARCSFGIPDARNMHWRTTLTSSTYVNNGSKYVWVANFDHGIDSNFSDNNSQYVFLTRSNQSAGSQANSLSNAAVSSASVPSNISAQQAVQNQSQSAQTQIASAQQATRDAQTRGDADAQRRGRRVHDPAAEAHECLSVITPDRGGSFGGFENKCNFPVVYQFCNYRPEKERWSASLDCQKRAGIGAGLVQANSRDIQHTNYTEYVYWFACKSPASAVDVTFEEGSGLSGRCRNYSGN